MYIYKVSSKSIVIGHKTSMDLYELIFYHELYNSPISRVHITYSGDGFLR